MFTSSFVPLPSRPSQPLHVSATQPPSGDSAVALPLVLLHGLGSSSAFWHTALLCPSGQRLLASRQVILYDFDGHGLSGWSGRDALTMDDLASDLKELLDALGLQKVALGAHSMSSIVVSSFASQNPSRVEKLFLLHPVGRNFPTAAAAAMRDRATKFLPVASRSELASAISTSAVSKCTVQNSPTTVSFIRHLVLSTNPEAYTAACRALADLTGFKAGEVACDVLVVGGAEDYLAGKDAVEGWAAEIKGGRGRSVVLNDVGHWGAIESPSRVADELEGFLRPQADSAKVHHFLLGTFRSPFLYTLSFDPQARRLALVHTATATGGHSWLHLSKDRRYLYATGWTDPPSLAAYRMVPSGKERPFPVTELINTASPRFLSGYVGANGEALFSASGPQVDVFSLDTTSGGFSSGRVLQSVSLVDGESDGKQAEGEMDFGGLRHGGHSADLSPDGSKLYVADIGRNCIWTYNVSSSQTLSLASKTAATRENDGPRHAWPHPNGRIVYVVQEHSSMIDVFELVGDKLEWRQGASIIPSDATCGDFWADEVRTSSSAKTLFGSTRGLTPSTRGFVVAFALLPSGLLASTTPSHRFETRTSGGWANAIAPCPYEGPNGQVWLTLTDSEVGFVQLLQWTEDHGFNVVDEVMLGEDIGASVAVWYD